MAETVGSLIITVLTGDEFTTLDLAEAMRSGDVILSLL